MDGNKNFRMKIALKEGTKVFCPQCGFLVATMAKDMMEGAVVDTHYFKFNLYYYGEAERAICKSCKKGVFCMPREKGVIKIFTEFGWLPE